MRAPARPSSSRRPRAATAPRSDSEAQYPRAATTSLETSLQGFPWPAPDSSDAEASGQLLSTADTRIVDVDEEVVRRRARNAEAARKSRRRRLELIAELSAKVEELQADKRTLQCQVSRLEGQLLTAEGEKASLQSQVRELTSVLEGALYQQQQQGAMCGAVEPAVLPTCGSGYSDVAAGPLSQASALDSDSPLGGTAASVFDEGVDIALLQFIADEDGEPLDDFTLDDIVKHEPAQQGHALAGPVPMPCAHVHAYLHGMAPGAAGRYDGGACALPPQLAPGTLGIH